MVVSTWSAPPTRIGVTPMDRMRSSPVRVLWTHSTSCRLRRSRIAAAMRERLSSSPGTRSRLALPITVARGHPSSRSKAAFTPTVTPSCILVTTRAKGDASNTASNTASNRSWLSGFAMHVF